MFVVLYRLARGAPANFDFPSTRAALKGHTELAEDETLQFVETQEEGRRFFGALLQSESTARRLATLITKQVPGSSPQILCGDPQILRILDIDLATGSLRGEHRPTAQ